MKMKKETTGPKNPNVVVGKSALDEFLEGWGSWRSKRQAKKADHRPTDEEMFGDSRDIVNAIKKKRKQQTKFMDSGFMLLIKFFVGIVDFIMSIVAWIFGFLFSFKGLLILGVFFYYFSDVDIKATVINAVGEQKLEEVMESFDADTKDFTEHLDEKLNAVKEQLDGIQINIKKTDGSSITFGGGEDLQELLDIEEPKPEPEKIE